jgi:hypothetical protein
MTIPYASATSGAKAREEITEILRRLGCEEIGFMENLLPAPESSKVVALPKVS